MSQHSVKIIGDPLVWIKEREDQRLSSPKESGEEKE